MTAHRAGADFIKVFPAATFGLAHIGAMLREMPELSLVPTGGVTPENLHAFFEVGCRAVGVGAQLVSKEVLAARDWARVTNLARRYVEAIAKWRSESRK
jgi:2-dehydro-3-deoxyphosphogluconate aldolase/(4S)-4-hydroxy-2-oxoglutarate aldolase